MDQFMVDVTDIPEAEEEDEVTLIGRDGGDQISVEELARLGGGFHYELICDLGKRVPRVYLRGGRIAGTKDYFQDVYEAFAVRSSRAVPFSRLNHMLIVDRRFRAQAAPETE